MLMLELKVLNENGRGDINCAISHQYHGLYESDTIVEYDGNIIESCSYPDFEVRSYGKFILYIRGADRDLDDNTFTVPYRNRNDLAGMLGLINNCVQSNLCTTAVVKCI